MRTLLALSILASLVAACCMRDYPSRSQPVTVYTPHGVYDQY